MIVQCPQCQSRYRVDEVQLRGRKQAQVKCTKCQTIFPLDLNAPPAATLPGSGPPPAATLVSKRGLTLQLPADKNVALSVTSGPAKGRLFSITKPRVTLGRANTDIVLDDPEVSRQHCALEMRGGTGLIIDLGSANGTYINDQKIETGQLEHLSEFRIGNSTLMLMITDKN